MIERKYLAHFIDAAHDMTYAACSYVRLGQDLEEYNDNLNPDVEVKKNILGEQSVKHNGYEVSGDIDPFYTDYSDTLSSWIWSIVNNRSTGDACKTSVVDVLIQPPTGSATDPSVVWAFREDVYVVPTTAGGDTSGVQVPFTIYRAGNRKAGTFNLSTKTFTAS